MYSSILTLGSQNNANLDSRDSFELFVSFCV